MNKKIFVIEDDMILQKAIIKALELDGFSVSQVSDGNDAIEKIQQENPDIILLDLILPNKRGEEILKELKNDSKLSHIPVYVLTEIGNMSSVADCIKAGAAGYFIKADISLQQIIDTIKTQLASSKED